jgi:O-antigen/teichoic acid export membrane protein
MKAILAQQESAPANIGVLAAGAESEAATGKLFVGRSVGKMVGASLASALTGIILIFWIPRILSVDDFGYWRSFLLYSGYAGFLHFGMVDGALLQWSRPRSQAETAGFPQSLLALALLHLVFLAIALGLLVTPLLDAPLLRDSLLRDPRIRHILLALAAYAFLFNLVGLVQVRLQSHLRFTAVAFGVAGPGALFVLCLASFRRWSFTLDGLLVSYLLAWSAALAVLLVFVARAERDTAAAAPAPAAPTGGFFGLSLRHMRAGWAIMLANTSYGLMQSADRITVNLTRPIHDFAIYSLAQSTIYVPVTIIAAVSRVAFSHFAGVAEGGREAAYTGTVRVLTAAWVLLLPYYLVVEWVVGRFLPRYVPGLPAGKILLLSVLFLCLISIVQANTWSLLGRQRRFFAGSLIALTVAFVTAWAGSRWIGTLTAIAWSQVGSALLWWLGNEWAMRGQNRLPLREMARVLTAFAAATGGLYLVSLWSAPAVAKILAYYATQAIFLLTLYRPELKLVSLRILQSARSVA